MIKNILIVILSVLLISIGIYYITNEPKLSEVENMPIHPDDIEIDVEQEDTEDQTPNPAAAEEPSDEQFKYLIVGKVKNALDSLYQKDIKVAAIGDSLTQGVGGTSKGGYIGILDETINEEKKIAHFDNFGKRGNRTDQLLKRIKEPEIATSIKKADIILVTIGANDIMHVVKENFTNLTYKQFAKEQVNFEKRLIQIFDALKDLNTEADIYFLGLYNPFDKYFDDIEELDLIIEEWNTAGESIAESYEHTTFIPMKDLFDGVTTNMFADDHFHPNEHGYYQMAKRVLEYLTDEEKGEHHSETEATN